MATVKVIKGPSIGGQGRKSTTPTICMTQEQAGEATYTQAYFILPNGSFAIYCLYSSREMSYFASRRHYVHPKDFSDERQRNGEDGVKQCQDI